MLKIPSLSFLAFGFCLFLVSCNQKQDAIGFLYQTVGEYGVEENAVRLGYSEDGVNINIYNKDALEWLVGPQVPETDIYGDPVFSLLSDGNWALTAWSSSGGMLYAEKSCPMISEDDVITISRSSEKGCREDLTVTGGKSSQIFTVDGSNYVFTMSFGEIYLNRLSDSNNSATDLTSICILEDPVDSLEDLSYGESAMIISDEDLLLSDTAIAQREDGTWVLFVKGIEKEIGQSCTPNTSCELCARNIYRTTSEDLIHWSKLEEVVSEASVPDAITMPNGSVRLYWQDFSFACDYKEDESLLMQMAGNAISTAYETEDDYEFSEPETLYFEGEEFEEDENIHYATNPNPILFPSEEAWMNYEACME